MNTVIIPNIFATNQKDFTKRFNKVLPCANHFQIDFMDGIFVKNKSIDVLEIPDLHNYKKTFEAHLMVANPKKYIDALQVKGFQKVIFHYEAIRSETVILELIKRIKSKKMIPGIVINPQTPVDKIFPFLKDVGFVMFMGIHPGAEHQTFIPEVYQNILQLRVYDKNISIQVDGGINLETAPLLAKSGCNYLNSGSFVGDAKNPKKAIQQLDKAFQKGLQ